MMKIPDSFKVGDYITFKGSIGWYTKTGLPERVCGLITKIGSNSFLRQYFRIKILNDPSFTISINYLFTDEESTTFVKIGRAKEYKEWKKKMSM